MSMVEQSESDDVFVFTVKTKELMITASSILLFLFQWKNKKWIYWHVALRSVMVHITKLSK